MGRTLADTCGPVGKVVFAAGVCLVLVGWRVDSFPQTQQPETLPELIYAFRYTLSNILTDEEYDRYVHLTPEELQEQAPELYEKVSQNVVRWTNEWIEHIQHTLDTVPPNRLAAARQQADAINAVLASYFESKHWSYKPLDVVFLPQRVFYDARRRNWRLRGMVVVYYPSAFFATVDPSSPMALVLVHETLHFNKRGRRYGKPLAEGLTEVAARYLVQKHGLLKSSAIRREEYYLNERKRVEVILKEMIRNTGSDRDQALEVLLEAYLTGDQDQLYAIFGKEPWERVIELSMTRHWYKSEIVKALHHELPPAEPAKPGRR